MEKSVISEYLAELGRKGGKARLQSMTAEQRRKVATKASKAAARARKTAARERRKQAKLAGPTPK